MSRTLKTGLDYFTIDTDFFEDEKIEFVSAKFGEFGELITIKLLSRIYRNGYYLKWGEDECVLFAKRAGENIRPELVNDVITELIKRGFFNDKLFNKYNILTSNGIQKRYFKAVERRKNVTILSEYWLNDNINDVNDNISFINANKSTTSKVKESKGKESKVKRKKGNFKKPTYQEVKEFCVDKQYDIDPGRFIDYYESVGWVVGKTKKPMKDWKASVRTWVRNNKDKNNKSKIQERYEKAQQKDRMNENE